MHQLELIIYMLLFELEVVLPISSCQYHERYLNYYKTRECYKSTLPIIAWTKTTDLQGCMDFARRRKALALNFSPKEAADYKNFSQNCQLLGCPETEKGLTLVPDVAFDYYSAYESLNNRLNRFVLETENATCIKSVGFFVLIENKHNYSTSIEKCQDIGGNLATVVTEIRTNHLSEYINDTLQDWYKVAYIGLDDIHEEGNFKTVNGARLSCFKYRAWAPGHPISKHKNEDCVVLDTDGMWRVVRCNRKLPALCELYPGEAWEEFQNVTCDETSTEGNKNVCTSKQVPPEQHNNSTRLEQCSMLHNISTTNSVF